jgi:hypothetical protein
MTIKKNGARQIAENAFGEHVYWRRTPYPSCSCLYTMSHSHLCCFLLIFTASCFVLNTRLFLL